MIRRISTLLLVPMIAMAAPPAPKTAPAQEAPAKEEATKEAPVKEDPAKEETEKPAKPLPSVADMIPATIMALEDPPLGEFQGGMKMAVTASDEETQAHVVAGLNHLHGGWEFQAARHFAAAAKRDPNCLLAHWGMVIALLSPDLETGRNRDAAMDRLLALVDAGAGNELERGYAYGLMQYFQEGPAGASVAFGKLAAQFPNDIQAGMFSAIFGRGGYNELGVATPDQEKAEAVIIKLRERYPNSTLLIHTLLTIHAEAPDLGDTLPLARRLCELAPAYPPYFQLLGHYEWRTGHHAEAAAAFSRASSLFDDWMKSSKVTPMDCPGWVASECYRCVALASKGDFETAIAAATKLAARPVPIERAASPGARLLLWEAKTLPARLWLNHAEKGDAARALASLPKPADIAAYKEKSLAHWYVDGLRFDIEALRLMDEGKYEDAAKVADAMSYHGEGMTRVQQTSYAGGERPYWTRSFRALEVLASELRGRLALAGPKSGHGSAVNWFRSAVDRQIRATMLLPPTVLTPMAIRLAEYQLATNKPAEAVENYRDALKAFPNDMTALKGLAKAAEKAGLKEEAEATQKKIEELSAQ